MLDRSLRPVKDRLLAPVARALGPSVHPTWLTIAGFAAGLGCAALLFRGAYAAGLALWIVNRLLDGLDGLVARARGRQSDFGGFLDLVLDFVVYALVPLALALGRPPVPALWIGLALLLASFYLNAACWMYLAALLEKRALGAAARGEPTSITMPMGLIEGTETIVLFALFMLFPTQLPWLFGVTAALVAATAAQRVVWAALRL